ncbi:MAG: bacterial transcriptional activator domain-containing protein [Anaerolineae bacterium]|nr:bacterial transcriptional activator domain-containing protein [Anaerolineae bacterium]
MTHDIADQSRLFGRHLNVLNAREQADTGMLISALVREFDDIQDKPVLLILDEYDRSDEADDVQVFVEALSNQLPDHSRIVINSRTMPRLPWVSMIAQQRAMLLQDDSIIRQDFYGALPEADYDLEVFGLGPGFVLYNGQPIDAWEGHLPRLLFFFALEKPVVTRSEICRAFWPDLDVDQAVNVFHVTKRRLHKALQFEMDILVHDDGYYYINPALSLDYDVMRFVAALMDARSHADEKPFEKWQRVVDMYQGPYLQGHDDPWILARRHDYRAGFIEALSHLAQIRLDADRPEHALGFLLRGAEEDPSREDLHRQIIRLYDNLGRRSEAAAYYQRLAATFKKSKTSLSDETQATFQEIMNR